MSTAAVTSDPSTAERRWTRGAWLVLGVLVLFTVCQLLLFGFAVAQPTDGCLIQQGTAEAQVIRGCIGSWPTPLRPGDEVLEISGRNLRLDVLALWPPPPPAGWEVGAQAPYTVRRDDVTLMLPVPLQRIGWGELIRLLGVDPANLLTNSSILLVVATAFALRPGSPATRLLLLSQGSSVIAQSLGAPSMLISQVAWDYWPSPLLRSFAGVLSLAFGWLSLPALLFLLLRFPRRVWPPTRWLRASATLIFGVAVAASLAVVLTNSFLPYLAQLGLYAALIVLTFVGTTVGTIRRVDDAVVRAQTAWLGLGFAIFSTQVFLWLASLAYPPFEVWLEPQVILRTVLSQAASLALPVCLAIAILRYRLFDIEVVINRTLVYGLLTASLGFTYWASVLVLQQLLRPLTGGSELAIVGSTLVVAAVFQPARRSIQDTVDRHFFRRKYDAQQLLERFSARLRQQVDLDALSTELLLVVHDSLQPVGLSLWLRPTSGSRAEEHMP